MLHFREAVLGAGRICSLRQDCDQTLGEMSPDTREQMQRRGCFCLVRLWVRAVVVLYPGGIRSQTKSSHFPFPFCVRAPPLSRYFPLH